MYDFIKGTLVQRHDEYVIIETNGIGYRIQIPSSIQSKLPQTGSNVVLYTSFVIREFSQTLYGFLSDKDRDLFETLLNINGVGPKLALSLIGHLTGKEFHRIVLEKDIASLCRVPGIGKKTAERLIIELKDKVSTIIPLSAADYQIELPQAQMIQDALSALINLGYTQSVAQKAINKSLDSSIPVDDLAALITASLKHIKNT